MRALELNETNNRIVYVQRNAFMAIPMFSTAESIHLVYGQILLANIAFM